MTAQLALKKKQIQQPVVEAAKQMTQVASKRKLILQPATEVVIQKAQKALIRKQIQQPVAEVVLLTTPGVSMMKRKRKSRLRVVEAAN